MSIDDQELRAIAFLALRVRRSTPGAGPWDEDGLMANLRKVQNRNLHMTVEHVLRHAADPKAKTPGVIQGMHTPAPPKEDRMWKPPRKSEECSKHAGQWPSACGPCATEGVKAFYDEPAAEPDLPAGLRGVELARAALKGGAA